MYMYVCMLTLLGTGTLTSIFQQLVADVGIAPTAHVVVVVRYIGEYCFAIRNLRTKGYLKSGERPSISSRQRWFLLAFSAVQLSGYFAAGPAVNIIGVALYSVVYSSGLVITAVISRVFLKLRPSPQQLLGILVVSAGLGYRSYLTLQEADSLGPDLDLGRLLLGILLAIFTTILFCLSPVLTELINKGEANPLPADYFSMYSASRGMGVLAVYLCTYTIPNWEELVTLPLAQKGNTLAFAGLLYVGTAVLSALHNRLYMEVTKLAGPVGNGLINAMRTATVAVVASFLYCSETKPNMCIDEQKSIVIALIVVGGTVYTGAPKATSVDVTVSPTDKDPAGKKME